jgi:hypothetical protein
MNTHGSVLVAYVLTVAVAATAAAVWAATVGQELAATYTAIANAIGAS